MSEEIKTENTKKKYEKAEDFIGWKSDDGLLEVIGIHGKQCSTTTYRVICHKCKEDKELFPLGYFVSTKGVLWRGSKPCGCSKSPRWTEEQFLILSRRAAQGRFVVHGFTEKFHGNNTKLNLECVVDGYKWITTISNIINMGNGCPKCSNRYRPSEQEAFYKCKVICKIENYEPLGFPDSYRNWSSRFEYICVKHGKQNVSYGNFVNKSTRCKGCYKERQKDLGNGNGYYPERKDEQDFLYVLDFDGQFIKVGRTFNLKRRLGKNQLQKESGISNIIKIRVFTATHQEIYDTEQEILEELRERYFQHYLDWTNECFENECLFILNKLLDNSGLEEIL